MRVAALAALTTLFSHNAVESLIGTPCSQVRLITTTCREDFQYTHVLAYYSNSMILITVCNVRPQGTCFAQLPELCGSTAVLDAAPAAALSQLCSSAVGDFPYTYDYDPANTSVATFQQYFSDAQDATPVGFARALLAASYNSANAAPGGNGINTWEEADAVLQIRAARRFAAHTYMLAAETTLDMANVNGIGDLSADTVLSLLLNRTVSGARGFCGFCGVWLARLLNEVVLPMLAVNWS